MLKISNNFQGTQTGSVELDAATGLILGSTVKTQVSGEQVYEGRSPSGKGKDDPPGCGTYCHHRAVVS